MLEIIALCSCACLACLWCGLAYEVMRNKCCDRCIFHDPYKWQHTKCKCACHKRITRRARSSMCKNSYLCLHPTRSTFSSYKFVCKMCRRVKPECICAKLFWHRMATGQPVTASYTHNTFLPDLTPQGILKSSPKQVIPQPQSTLCSQDTKKSQENQNCKMDHNHKQWHLSFRQILRNKLKKEKE